MTKRLQQLKHRLTEGGRSNDKITTYISKRLDKEQTTHKRMKKSSRNRSFRGKQLLFVILLLMILLLFAVILWW